MVINDQASFETFLTSRSFYSNSNLTNIVVTDFNLIAGRLQCNLTADGTELDLSKIAITNVIGIGNIAGLQSLDMRKNLIIVFDFIINLPSSLQSLNLSENKPIDVPNFSNLTSLTILNLAENELTNTRYASAESWASNLTPFTTTCSVFFYGNIDSISGTNLEAILISKNCNVIA